MEIDDQYINAFLNGGLTVEEQQKIRSAMATDEALAARIGQRKLEMMVVEELDRQYWGQKVKRQEESYRKRVRSRRLVAYAAAAVIAVIAVFLIAFPPFTPPEYTGPIAFNRDYNTNLKSLQPVEEFSAEQLYGTWEAAITEQPGLLLNLELEVFPDDEFTVTIFYTLNNLEKEGDKISAGGTYKLNGRQLALNLDEASIKRAPGASPFETAPIELWLKSRRLFQQETEIAGLSENNLILKYGPAEGLEWIRQ